MNFPKIGETITPDMALELCEYFNLYDLKNRIENNPNKYKDWVFDGISLLNDKFAATISHVDQYILTTDCALPHDLRYGYGEPGNKKERKDADEKFKSDLIKKAKMNKFWAFIFYSAVRIGGAETLSLSYSWAFAHKS